MSKEWMPRFRLGMNAMVTAVAVMVTPGAWAESEIQAVDTEEMPVTELRDMVVTAARDQEMVSTIPANITVITREDIVNTAAQNVPDVLKYVAGIQVSDWLGNGRNSTVDIRGFGETSSANTLVLVDGRRINAPDLSGVDWTTIPLERIERIEIVRGGGAVIYGDNASGGVVNIITRKGSGAPTISGETRIGSYQTFKQALAISGNSGDWSYDMNGSYASSDGYRDNGYFRNKTAGMRLTYENPEKWFGLDMSAGIKDDRYGLASALPAGADRTSSLNPRSYGETGQYYVRLVPSLRLGDDSEFSLGLNYRSYDQYTFTAGVSMMWGPWENVYEYNMHEYGISPQFNTTQNLFGMVHSLVAGMDYYSSDLHYITSIAPMGDRHRHEAGWYVHDRIEIAEGLFLALGYRRSRVNYDFDLSDDAVHNLDAANIGLTYTYAPGSKVFLAFDRSYRTMLLDELGGMNLPADQPIEPQISKQYQAGIKHCFGEGLTLAATLFQIDTENEIFYDPYVAFLWGAWAGENTNYEKTRRRGVELELEARPHDKLRLFANYTYVNPELEDGVYDGNEIPGVARHTGSFGVTAYPLDELTVDVRARWSKDKVMISDWQNVATNWDGNFIVVDAMVTYELKPFTFYVGVNNIFNEEYSEYGVYAFDWDLWQYYRSVYPSPERNFVAGVRFTKEF
jgi:iron complex outermembrane receptor protein